MSPQLPATPYRAEPLILVQEISHRVVNEYTQAIATIRLAAAGVTSLEARAALIHTATKLRDFADAHRALQAPAPSESADLGEYLERLCAAVMAASLKDRGVRLTLVTGTIRLHTERCWRVALIVSELITNAVRHGLRGGAGTILVEVDEADGDVVCRVGDNGRADPAPTPSRGLTVVRGLAAELGGRVDWCFTATGTTARLAFPLILTGGVA